MNDSGIDALARRYGLPGDAAPRLATLAALLSRDPAAATAVRDPERVIDQHLADALVALELPEVRGARSVADIGSGAGIPGLPLALARPEANVALVDSNGRKCRFLRRAADECSASNVSVENVRAEAWDGGLERHDLVTARALAPLAVVAEYAAPLLQLGGSLVAWRGARDAAGAAAAARAAAELGLEVGAVIAVRPFPGAQSRHLHVMSKVRRTPERFPRRPGVARKRPLGSVR